MVLNIALSVTVCLLLLDTLGADMPSVVSRSSRRHYCGEDLTSTLSLLCKSWYKRASPPITIYDSNNIPETDEMMYQPFLSKQSALRMVRDTRFRIRTNSKVGIVDECCRKSCTIEELEEYCGNEDE